MIDRQQFVNGQHLIACDPFAEVVVRRVAQVRKFIEIVGSRTSQSMLTFSLSRSGWVGVVLGSGGEMSLDELMASAVASLGREVALYSIASGTEGSDSIRPVEEGVIDPSIVHVGAWGRSLRDFDVIDARLQSAGFRLITSSGGSWLFGNASSMAAADAALTGASAHLYSFDRSVPTLREVELEFELARLIRELDDLRRALDSASGEVAGPYSQFPGWSELGSDRSGAEIAAVLGGSLTPSEPADLSDIEGIALSAKSNARDRSLARLILGLRERQRSDAREIELLIADIGQGADADSDWQRIVARGVSLGLPAVRISGGLSFEHKNGDLRAIHVVDEVPIGASSLVMRSRSSLLIWALGQADWRGIESFGSRFLCDSDVTLAIFGDRATRQTTLRQWLDDTVVANSVGNFSA